MIVWNMPGRMGALFFDILHQGEWTGFVKAWRIKLRQERPLCRTRRRKKVKPRRGGLFPAKGPL